MGALGETPAIDADEHQDNHVAPEAELITSEPADDDQKPAAQHAAKRDPVQDISAYARRAIQERMRALSKVPSFDKQHRHMAAEAAHQLRSLDTRVIFPKMTIAASIVPAGEALNRQLSQLSADLAAVMTAALEPAVLSALSDLKTTIQIDPDIFARFRETIERVVPDNVRGMGVDEMLSLVACATTHRCGVFYAIRAERLPELIAATGHEDDMDRVLESFEDEDFQHLVAVLGKVIESGKRRAGLATLLVDATESLKAGFPASSQALSTTVWDSEITAAAGFTKAITYAKALSQEDDLEERSLFELFQTGVHAPLIKAYTTPNDSPLYSRNGTIHGAQPAQFSKANAVRALTIAVSLLAWRAVHATQSGA